MIWAAAYLALLPIPSLDDGLRTRENGLEVLTFERPQGKILVYLPEDLAPGDTISGTVTTMPNGSGSARDKNDAILRGTVVTVGGQVGVGRDSLFKWLIPTTALLAVPVAVATAGAPPTASVDVPVAFGATGQGGPVTVDPIVNFAKPIAIKGSFDGDLANTKVSYVDGSPGVVLAESPRSMVFVSTNPQTGPTSFTVSEAGKETQLKSNCVRLELQASKLNLLQGESTQLRVKVTGLQGLEPEDFPIPLELRNLTPSIIRIEGESSHMVSTELRYTMVGRNGEAQLTYAVAGIGNGAFVVRGVLFNVSLHDAKRVMTAQMFNQWVAGLIVVYEAKIKSLKAELAKDPKDPGLQANLARKEKILENLRAWKGTQEQTLNVAKTAVDQVLALDSMFSVAADLITIAADFLGYTDIPLPGVGAALKGAKILFSKYPKVIEAIQAAEKIFEEYSKLKEAQAKANKLEELKKAMEKAGEAARAAG